MLSSGSPVPKPRAVWATVPLEVPDVPRRNRSARPAACGDAVPGAALLAPVTPVEVCTRGALTLHCKCAC